MSVIDVGLNSALKHHRLTMGVTRYKGQGRCRQVMCYGDATLTDLHIHELRRWAQRINWKFDAITQTFYSSALEDS